MKALKMRISFLMSLSEICITIYEGHKKKESPLHESLKNVHWVFSHKVGVYIELGSPSGGIENLYEKPYRQIWCAAIYIYTHIYLCIYIYVMRSKIFPTGWGGYGIYRD